MPSQEEIFIVSRENAVCLEQDEGEAKEGMLQRKGGLNWISY